MCSRPSLFLFALLAMATAGCAAAGKEVDTPDLTQCAADEGLIVVRFLTQHAEEEDLQGLERDPDIDYTVHVAGSKSQIGNMLNAMSRMAGFQIEAKNGPALFLRKMEAGEYYLHEIRAKGKSAPIAVKFDVQPGKLTYIGDLEVIFIGGGGLFGNLKSAMVVSANAPAVQGELFRRFPGAPLMETRLMAVEGVTP